MLINGKEYCLANPDKKIIETKISEPAYLNTWDTITFEYKVYIQGVESAVYNQVWTHNRPDVAVVSFKVNIFDDDTYECIHSVNYVKEV